MLADIMERENSVSIISNITGVRNGSKNLCPRSGFISCSRQKNFGRRVLKLVFNQHITAGSDHKTDLQTREE